MTAAEIGDLAARLWPVVVFLLTITLTAELAERVGVFEAAGQVVAAHGRGRVWLLWLLFAGLCVTCTIFLSLDTTAVLLTPVGLAIARQVNVSAMPFALTTLWIANTGSLLLPVSNLTNLLALHRLGELGVGHAGYAALMWRPALVAIVVTLLLIAFVQRGKLVRRFHLAPPSQPHDRGLLVLGSTVCVVIGPCFAFGMAPWAVASVAAAVLVLGCALRAPQLLRSLQLPWLMAAGFVLVSALVTIANSHGLAGWFAGLGDGEGPLDLLVVAWSSAGLANGVNNLPAYLLMEPVAGESSQRLAAALIGVNAGPLITPWASLATLLWLQRCRAGGLQVPVLRLAVAGAVCAILTVTLATLAL